MRHVVFSYQLRGLHIVYWFPDVVTFGVPFPLDQVLEFTPLVSMGLDSFNFILRFAFDHVRRRPHKVLAMFFCFNIGRKE